MSNGLCEREIEVVNAIQTSVWQGAHELRAHAANCTLCRDAAAVAFAMAEAEALAGAESHPLPDASLVWWKAQLRARREAVERASEPVRIFTRAAYVFGCVILASILWQQWARVSGLLSFAKFQSLSPASGWLGRFTNLFTADPSFSPSTPLWALLLGFAAVVLIVTGVVRLALD